MSTYELDDEMVRSAVLNRHLPTGLFVALEKQLPVEAPTKIGAVVRTDRGVFLRADGSDWPWIRAHEKGAVFVEAPDWLTDDGIGGITEVLSEGVDL